MDFVADRALLALALGVAACGGPSGPPSFEPVQPPSFATDDTTPRQAATAQPPSSLGPTPAAPTSLGPSSVAPTSPPRARPRGEHAVDGALVPVPPAELDDELARLPPDVRVASEAFRRTHDLDCPTSETTVCELRADLDGDGSVDRVVGARSRATKQRGLAVFWSNGTVSILGAGTESRQLVLEIDVDRSHADAAWRVVRGDHVGIEAARIAPRLPGRSAFRLGDEDTDFAAPGAKGAALRLDGGDAAAFLYWAGSEWRMLPLGF